MENSHWHQISRWEFQHSRRYWPTIRSWSLHDMLESGRRTRPNYPVLQETVLGWTLSGKTPAVKSQWLATQLLLRDNNSLEHNLNQFWELETVEQPSMTSEQQSMWTTLHLHYNSRTWWKICGQTSNQDGSQATWIISPLCRAKAACHRTQAGKTTRTQNTISWIYEGVWRTRLHGTSEFPRT